MVPNCQTANQVFLLFSLLVKFLGVNGWKQILDRNVIGKCFWQALTQIDFFYFCFIILSFGLGETSFLTPNRSCDKAIKWILCGWLRLTGPVLEMAFHQAAKKAVCRQPTNDWHAPLKKKESIHLTRNEPVIETFRYVFKGQHRLHFNKIFYPWKKWPSCVFGISPRTAVCS